VTSGGNALGWEFLTVTFPRGTSRSGAREYAVGQAAAGQWVLDRTRVYPDGTRRVRLRRRAMRVARTG
jgi:hypothetical protein